MKKCTLVFFSVISLLVSCSKDHEDKQNVIWNDLTKEEVEQKLQEYSGNNDANVSSIVSGLKSNENIEEVFTTADKMQIIAKFKDDDSYTVYPIHLPIDPFAEANNSASKTRSVPSKISWNYTKTGRRGKVAVFNYFSNNYYYNGNDNFGTRTTQNMLIDYMCRELNENEYGVEFYGYEDMTFQALRNVLNSRDDYKAVVILSHGFSDNNHSYFLIGEEYDSYKAKTEPLLKDDGYEVPLSYKFWNSGISSFKERYDFAVPVNKMDFGDHVLLYMGSCDAYRNESDMKGKCVGWDGTNSSAQAHVALLFHKLLRGKNLNDALDINDADYTYYSSTASQTDTWMKDPVYESTKLKCSMSNVDVAGELLKRQWGHVPNYYKNSYNIYPKIRVYDASGKMVDKATNYGSSFITTGICFMKDHKFKLVFICGDYLPYDYVYIKATPLRWDASPIVKKIKKSKLEKGFKIELEENGVWELSASIDEKFYTEILLHKPIVFVYAKPFKENSIPLGDVEEEDAVTFDVGGVSFDMIKVEGGSFMMGAEDDDPDLYYDDEKPQHKVTLSSFMIGDTEVTQELWKAIMGTNPSYYKGDELPVERVSWDDCQLFIKKLNELTGRTFRLPTEAEWEYAARGGKKGKGYRYAGSDEVDEVAWTYYNCNNTTHPVATKLPNELGIYDMSGNVYEWCQDWYAWDYYKYSPANNPCNTTESSSENAYDHQHIHRGGCISVIIKDLRNAMRGDYINDPTLENRGLRLVLTL